MNFMQIFGLILLTLHSLCVLHVEKWLKCLSNRITVCFNSSKTKQEAHNKKSKVEMSSPNSKYISNTNQCVTKKINYQILKT